MSGTVHERTIAAAGTVGVLMGGHSAEREVSMNSGGAVLSALRAAGVDACALVWDDELLSLLDEARVDRIFIALHGRGGEDGQVQGMLDVLGIPYTGSGVLGCALAMDKIRSKQVWNSVGIPTPEFAIVEGDSSIESDIEFGWPVIVKPSREGSSFGITKVRTADELDSAIQTARQYDSEILVERWIGGGEYTTGIVRDRILPVIKLETPHEIYDYEAKYISDTTRYICPCGLTDDVLEHCNHIARAAFDAVGASGWGRVDFMLDEQQNPWMIEVNTVPGMTDHSLIPMGAAALGLSFEQLVVEILSTSMSQFQ